MTAPPLQPTPGLLSLVARRTIRAPIERVFAAWTQPALLVQWWGPPGVSCPEAQVDLRPGGGFRLANALPDGGVLWIAGDYRTVAPHHSLDFSWYHEPLGEQTEVTEVRVRLRAVAGGTEVALLHEGFGSTGSRDTHAQGWEGCLDGLADLPG